MIRTRLLLLLLTVAACVASLDGHAQHPVAYGSLQATSQVASFKFDSLDRAIVHQTTASFYSPEPVSLTFEILVDAEGQVKYVRAPRLTAAQQDLRLACTSALYGFAFAPTPTGKGETWLKATMVCE